MHTVCTVELITKTNIFLLVMMQKKKTKKSFSPIGCARNDKSLRFFTIRLVSLTTAWRLPDNWMKTAWWLHNLTVFLHIVSAETILYSFLNLEIVENSNSCRNISISYLINWYFAAETIQGRKLYEEIRLFPRKLLAEIRW